MARTTKITVKVEHKQAISSLDLIIAKFKQVDAIYSKLTSNGKNIKINIDSNIPNLASSFEALNKNMNTLNNNLKDYSSRTKTGSSDTKKFTDTLGEYIILQRATKWMMNFINTTKQLENATFSVGVASQKTITDIDQLKSDFLTLAETVPVTATELANAVDALIRSGRSYGDAMKIVEQASKLAVASGDGLKETSAVVTKILVALAIKGENAQQALNALHSTAIQTATSMGGLSDSFKQVAGVLGALTISSKKQGEELEGYKQTMLELGSAVIGTFNNLGKGASEAGTKTKVLFNKLSAMEKTAKNLFNDAVAISGITFGSLGLDETKSNVEFTADALADLARKDLPKAVEVVSKLYKQGVLTGTTLQKMFTARHALDIENVLALVNGDVEKFTKGIASGIDYLDDYSKQIYNLNNQLTLFKNNIMSSQQGMINDFKKGLTMTLKDANAIMNWMDSDTKQTLANVTGTVLQFTLLSSILSKVVPVLKGLIAGGLGWGFAIPSAVIVGFMQLQKYVYDMETSILSFAQNTQKVESETNKLKQRYEALEKSVQNTVLSYKQLSDENYLGKFLQENINLFDILLSKNKELSNALKASGELTGADTSGLEISQYQSDLAEQKKMIEELDNFKIKKEQAVQAKIEQYAKENTSTELQRMYQIHQMKLAYQAGEELSEIALQKARAKAEITDENELKGRMDTLKNQEQDIYNKYLVGKQLIAKTLQLVSDDVKIVNDEISKTSEKLTELENKVKLGQESFDSYTELAKRSLTTLSTGIATEQEKLLSKYGKFLEIDADGKITKQYEGLDALMKVYGDKTLQTLNARKENLEKVREKAMEIQNVAQQTLQDEKASTEDKQKALELYEEQVRQIQKLDERQKIIEISEKKQIANQEKIKSEVSTIMGEFGLQNLKKQDAISLEKDLIALIGERILLEQEATGSALDKARIEQLKKLIALAIANSQAQISENKAKADKNVYRIKYNSLLKETYDLELKISQLGENSIRRDYEAYKIQLKRIVESQKEYKSEMAVRGAKLTQLGAGQKSGESQKQYLDRLMEQKKAMESLGVLTGEQGAKTKALYEEISGYLNANLKLQSSLKDPIIETLNYSEKILNSSKDQRKAFKELQIQYKEARASLLNMVDPTVFSDKFKMIREEFVYSLDNLDSIANRYVSESNPMANALGQMIKSTIGDIDLSDVQSINFDEIFKQFNIKYHDTYKKQQELINKKRTGGELNEADTQELSLLDEQLFRYTEIMDILNEMYKLKVEMVEKDKESYQIQLDTINKRGAKFGDVGGILSAFGSATGIGSLGNIGETITSMGNLGSSLDEFNLSMSKEGAKFSDNLDTFSKTVQGGIDIGVALGGLVGGQQGSQIGGLLSGLGGIASGALGLAGWQGQAISMGLGLVGGMLGKGSGNAEAEANKLTEKANKLYEENNSILTKFVNSMQSLNESVDGLNTTLVSTFSKIPTIGNIERLTGGMTSMLTTLMNTRNFPDVAYQTEHKKKSSGFLGIGSSSYTYLKTHEVSVKEMLTKYGVTKAIEDLTSEELRGFATWLKNYNLGVSDNFDQLGKAVEDYAEALDQMEKNIQKFFYDTTMESFQGISSLKQEELRQQIEDFYKNLGIQIDDTIREQINNLAEQMTIMVTVMEDVRGNFVKDWKNTGLSAGKAFLTSMQPYIDAMMTNISQIFYDVYFSDINASLEGSFKKMSEQLVELKKQGQKLNWDDVGSTISKTFDEVIKQIKLAENETESFNGVLKDLQDKALEAGLTLGELGELGLLTQTQKDVLDSFKSALTSTETEGALVNIGNMLGEKVGESIANHMISTNLTNKVLNFSAYLDKVLSGNLSMSALGALASEGMSVALMMEQERRRMEAIMDLFNYSKEINYTNANENITYQTGTAQSVINNFYLSASVNAGVVIPQDDIEDLVDSTLDITIEKLKSNKGIDLADLTK